MYKKKLNLNQLKMKIPNEKEAKVVLAFVALK